MSDFDELIKIIRMPLDLKATHWQIDVNNVVCLFRGEMPVAWMNRQVFESILGRPLTEDELREHEYKPKEVGDGNG